jgi:hypothetical protein
MIKQTGSEAVNALKSYQPERKMSKLSKPWWIFRLRNYPASLSEKRWTNMVAEPQRDAEKPG